MSSMIIRTVGRLNAALPSDTQIRLTRTFDAPRQMVWDAHTKPDLIRRWLLRGAAGHAGARALAAGAARLDHAGMRRRPARRRQVPL